MIIASPGGAGRTSRGGQKVLDRVWGTGFVGDPKVVDVNIRRLRQKIEDDPAAPRHLISVRGYGYRWQGGEPS